MKITKVQPKYILYLGLLLISLQTEAIYIYISVNGNDDNPGSINQPLASIERALELVVNKGLESSDTIFIQLFGGTYYPANTIVIKSDSCKRFRNPIVIKSYDHQQVIISGGKPLSKWEKANLKQAPSKTKGKIWMTEVPKGTMFYSLFDETGILPRAASPKFKSKIEYEDFENGDGKIIKRRVIKADHQTLYFQKGQIDHVKDFSQAELFILPRYDWVSNYLPIETVDLEKRELKTSVPGTYCLETPPTWTGLELFFQVENVPEFLDEPGEWLLDSNNGLLYLIARDEHEPHGIVMPELSEIVRIEGDLVKGDCVSNILFEELTFKHADRMTWRNGRLGVQHDWGIVDGQWGCIRIRGGRNIEVKNCLFEYSGGDGIRIDLSGWNNYIHHNEFRNIGGAAISLIGYGPGYRDELHHNTISNNHIHHCSQLWWSQPGILICQSSNNTIRNNLIHDLPYNGIAIVGGRSGLFNSKRNAQFDGDGISYTNWEEIPEEVDQWYEKIGYINTRNNIVEHNEIYNVVTLLGDGNGIYVSGTGPGNVLYKNYIHTILSDKSAGGLRFDNDTYYCLMFQNVVWNVAGSNIVSKEINNIENNILVNSPVRSVLFLPKGPKWGTNIKRNIIVNNNSIYEPTMNKSMSLADILVSGELDQCIIDYNLWWISDNEYLANRVLQNLKEQGLCLKGVVADPQFTDMDHGNFTLSDTSPAIKIGFIPFDDWGLIEETGILNKPIK